MRTLNDANTVSSATAKPILKWAGGKTQLLSQLRASISLPFGKYIEPFIGGGALFFALNHSPSVIADSNPELINLYRTIRSDVDGVIRSLRNRVNSEEEFYATRAQDWSQLEPADAAARMIYLNRTCFNGLYRVNRSGGFNVPFGNYKNPRILNEPALRDASAVLGGAEIVCGDYLDVTSQYAVAGDLVFLDPPYLPISKNSDFKRYTANQFRDDHHIELAREARRLVEIGCQVVLTNSNHPAIHELYAGFTIEVVETRRLINSNVQGRSGQDVIIRRKADSASETALRRWSESEIMA